MESQVSSPDPVSGHILIADDDPSIVLLLRHFLNKAGYRVSEARNGREAIGLCREHNYELAIIDLVMPDIDGIRACRDICTQNSQPPPVLIVTSLDDDVSVTAAFDAGAIDYVTKPINWSVFGQRVRRIVIGEQYRRQVEKLQYHDSLTGLPNRNLLLDRLESAILRAQRSGNMIALISIDIDNLKLINNSLGYHNGDKLIQSVATRLRKSIRDTDTLSRSGGDEFNLVIENLSQLEDIGSIVAKFSRIIPHNMLLHEQDIYIKASMGISVYPQDGDNCSSLLNHAESALYRAKEKGGDCYEFYSPELSQQANRRLNLETSLRKAIKQNELLVYYQPKMNLHNGLVSGMEALVRWNHPQQGIVPPDEFIGIAEETGLIIPLGEQVIEQTCAQFKSWQQQGIAVDNVSINVSARQFKEQDLVSLFKTMLDKYQLDASQLEIELTESTLLSNEDHAESRLNQLHQMGIRIAIDDFGTGYASLSYLKSLPIDILKIDRSFTDGITHDPDDIAIVTAIYGLAKGLGMELVAEGIETTEQLEKIIEMGIDYGQGYLWGAPCAADDFITLINRLNS